MRVVRCLLLLAAVLSIVAVADPAVAQFSIGGDPRVNPSDFRITTFASGLNFPNGLAQLSDGSILVATSNPNGHGTFWASSGELLRFTDTDKNGIADGPGQLMYSDPVGVWVAMKVAGPFVFITSAKQGLERITVLRMNNGPASPYAFVGTLNFTFPPLTPPWEHKTYALAARPTPGGPANTYEVYFNVGSRANFDETSDPITLSGLLQGTMEGASIYRVTVTDTGNGATISNLTLIARGLRNAAGMDFHRATGDLYFEDNGIDGLVNRDEPLSADELNRIAAADLGRLPVPDFGFPSDYIDYHTGQRVGNRTDVVQPLVTFRPLPCASCPDPGDPNGADGAESEGPSGIIFAPPSFPPYVNNGVFIGFHGKFSAPPSGNEENPLVFWDMGTGQYFHFIESFQLGHGDQLLATDDSLFIADMAADGLIDTNGGTGIIYQIQRRAADTGQPIPIFTSPAEGATVTGTVTVGMSVSGSPASPYTFTLRLDGGSVPLFTASTSGTTASFDWNTSGVAAGAHQLQLTVQDSAGNSRSTTRNVTVAGALTASITSPAEGAAVSGTVPIAMSAVNAVGTPITFTLTIDGTQAFTASGTTTTASFNWNTNGLAPGSSHQLRLTVQDGAGRTASATRTVTVQQGTISVFITQPASDGTTVSGVVWFTIWLQNAAAGSRTLTLTVDGATVDSTTTTSNGPISLAWNSAGASGGTHTATVSVRDSTGNSGSANRTVVIAGTCSGPTAAGFTSPAEGAMLSGTVTVGMTVSTCATGTITWTLRLDGGATPIFTTSGTAKTASFGWNTTSVAPGTHQLQLTAQDGAGATATATRNVTVAGPLSASITSPSEGATVSGSVPVSLSEMNGTGTITWTVRVDDGTTPIFSTSGAAATASFNWDSSKVTPGTHQLQLTVQDGGGRTATATRSVTVTAPSLTASITSPTESATVSGTTPVSLTESNGTGTITWTVRLDGGSTPIFSTSGAVSTASFNWDTSTVSAGPHQLQLTVQDGAGRTATATRNVTVQQGTIRVFITQPGTDGTMVSGTVWFTIWLDNAAAGTRNLTLSIDGTAVATTSTTSNGPISMAWSSTGASGGTHTATVSVRDAANNTGSANRTIVTQGPALLTASFTSPTEGATVFGTITVGMSATNASGTPIGFTLTVDGTQVFTTSGASTTASFNWNANSVANGPHALGLTVQDGGGRTATATRNVTVSSPPPLAVSFTSPTEGSTIGGAITVAATATGGSGTLQWSVLLDDTTTIFTTSTTASSMSFTWDTRTVGDGAHRLTVRVRDGLVRDASSSVLVTVKQPSTPTIKVYITQPNADGATVSGTAWFTIWIDNAAAGNKTYTMSVDGTTVGTTNTTSNGPVSMAWPTNGTSNGSHAVTISVQDSAGATGSAVRRVTVAN